MENKVTTSSTIITYWVFFSLEYTEFSNHSGSACCQTTLGKLRIQHSTKQQICSGATEEAKCIYYYIHLKISLSSQLLHMPLKRNHTNEKIFSSTNLLSTVKED